MSHSCCKFIRILNQVCMAVGSQIHSGKTARNASATRGLKQSQQNQISGGRDTFSLGQVENNSERVAGAQACPGCGRRTVGPQGLFLPDLTALSCASVLGSPSPFPGGVSKLPYI